MGRQKLIFFFLGNYLTILLIGGILRLIKTLLKVRHNPYKNLL